MFRNIFFILSLIFICVFYCKPASAHDPVTAFGFKGYEGEGEFVETPALVGNITGTAVGLITGGSVYWLVRPIFGENNADAVLVNTMLVTTKPMGAIAGAPFYIAKKILWDAPRMLFFETETYDE